MNRTTITLLFALAAITSACGSDSRYATKACTTGSHLCACYGNTSCDGKLVCVSPEHVCLTHLEATADGGYASLLNSGNPTADAATQSSVDGGVGADSSAGSSDDAGMLPTSGDAAVNVDASAHSDAGKDAAVSTTFPHTAFVGMWMCSETQTDVQGNNPMTTLGVSLKVDSQYGVDNIAYHYWLDRFDKDTLITKSAGVNMYSRGDYLEITLHTATMLTAVDVHPDHPKMLITYDCTK